MGTMFIIFGLILILLGYMGYRQNSRLNIIENNDLNNNSREMKKIAELEENINILSNTLEEVLQKIDTMSFDNEKNEEIEENEEIEVSSFSDELSKQQQIDEYREIREAFQRGEEITEIAKRYNRGKGEIQLILNLKK